MENLGKGEIFTALGEKNTIFEKSGWAKMYYFGQIYTPAMYRYITDGKEINTILIFSENLDHQVLRKDMIHQDQLCYARFNEW